MKQLINNKRDVNGILLLDKPKGLSSNAALQQVKRLYCARKAGHTGSLDPLASGMLPICFGKATKMSQQWLNADKIYHVRAQLGIQTTTGDAEGSIVAEKAVPDLTPKIIEQTLNRFRGEIQQVPPMYSALKHQGQPLYKLARRGITIERLPRAVIIHHLSLLSYENHQLELQVHCSKGTYIRTLIEDIGEALHCGAHVVELRRLSVGNFSAEQMISLEQLLALGQRFEELDRYLL